MTCERLTFPDGTVAIVCSRGRRRQRCVGCQQYTAEKLCDGIIPGRARSCSAPVCVACALHTDPDNDLCPGCAARARAAAAVAELDILLVTGARALAELPAAEEWARAQITEAAARIVDGGVLVTGDAAGPDAWALARAEGLGRQSARYALDGCIYTSRGITVWGIRGNSHTSRTWPLERNRVMVHHVAHRAAQGRRVQVLALRAPWARTNGTAHTITRAAEAGLVVVDKLCPEVRGG